MAKATDMKAGQRFGWLKAVKPTEAKRKGVVVWEFKCDCGEDDTVVLDFDHVRGAKRFSIGESAKKGFSLKTMKSEIAKCEVRCANCHRRKTHQERQEKRVAA